MIISNTDTTQDVPLEGYFFDQFSFNPQPKARINGANLAFGCGLIDNQLSASGILKLGETNYDQYA